MRVDGGCHCDSESEMQQYLGDLCHEWATERHPSVKRLDWSGAGSGDFG